MSWFSNEAEDDAWITASLRFLGNRLPITNTIWPSQSGVDSAKQRLAKTREWVELVEDRRMRKECLSWCDYAQTKIEEAQHELDTKERHNEHEKWRKETAEKDRRAQEILAGARKPIEPRR